MSKQQHQRWRGKIVVLWDRTRWPKPVAVKITDSEVAPCGHVGDRCPSVWFFGVLV